MSQVTVISGVDRRRAFWLSSMVKLRKSPELTD